MLKKLGKTMGKQILIIGNGFDLACGLDSSYKNFFKWRFDKLKDNSEFQENIKHINEIFESEYPTVTGKDGPHMYVSNDLKAQLLKKSTL